MLDNTHAHARIHNPVAEPARVYVHCIVCVLTVCLLSDASTVNYLLSTIVNYDYVEYDDTYYLGNFTPYLSRVHYARFFYDDMKN